mmetsp:Transcript_41992/g.83077  ORF Transcript_41992/g.83077 Transcript_41992/m.83077 type:complete len:264 (-) Transcript_41992:451-1242(-)
MKSMHLPAHAAERHGHHRMLPALTPAAVTLTPLKPQPLATETLWLQPAGGTEDMLAPPTVALPEMVPLPVGLVLGLTTRLTLAIVSKRGEPVSLQSRGWTWISRLALKCGCCTKRVADALLVRFAYVNPVLLPNPVPAFVDPPMELCGLRCSRRPPTGETDRKRHRPQVQLQLTPPTPGLKLPRLLRLGIGRFGVTPPVAAPGGWCTLVAACHGHSQTLRPVRHSRIEVPMCRQTVLRVLGAAVAETDMPKTLDARGGDVIRS